MKAIDGSYRGGFDTHQVKITKGAFELTPIRRDEKGAAIKFETSEIRFGATSLGLSSKTASLAQANELHIKRGANVIEQLENREDGIEQRWVFEKPLEGDGDLFVKVSVSGFDPEKTVSSNGGLHFFAPLGLGFRYSHAKWIDSEGGAWNIPAVWEDGRIAMRVDQHILKATKFPAMLDPTVEAEEAVDDPVLGNSGQNTFAPYIGTRGDGYLAVWADQRMSNSADIWAARITASGAVLDYNGGIIVNSATGTQTTPVVARVGANWVVVWRTANDIAAATVTDDAGVTQLGAVSSAAANERFPAIDSNGGSALVAWQSDNDIMAAYYNGSSFGGAFAVATADAEADPAVAAAPGGGYIVSWHDNVGIKAQLVDSAGALSGAAIDVLAASGATVAAAFNGTDYVLVYTYQNNLAASRVSTAGLLVDAVPVNLNTAAGLQGEASVSCNNNRCVAEWSDTRTLASTGFDVYAQSFDFNMGLLGGEVLVSGGNRYEQSPSIASTQLGFVSVWEDQRTGGPSLVIGARIANDGSLTDPTGYVVNQSYNAQQEAATATATNGSQVVMWSDSTNVGNDIVGIRYGTIGGGRLDSPPKVITNAANDQATPSVAFDGTDFLAVWSDVRGTDRDIYAGRFTTAGTSPDGSGFAVTTATGIQGAPDVASNGAGVSLVVWADRQAGNFDIYGAIVTGGTAGAPFVVSAEVNDQVSPAVAYDPNSGHFIAVWSDQRLLQSGDIYGTRISTGGSVLDAAGVVITGSQFEQVQPDIAVSGTTIMVVWDDRRSDPNGDIIGGRVSAANNMLTALDIGNGSVLISYQIPGRQNSPSLVPLPGNSFLCAWIDHRNSATAGSDIFGVALNASGVPADSTGFEIAGGAGDQTLPGFQSDPNSNARVAMVYQYFRSDLKISRVFRRLITMEPTTGGGSGAPNGTFCQQDAQCASGICSDWMCCNTTCGGHLNQTDCQTCNTIYGGTQDGTCTVIATEAICRNFGTFECDIREYCDNVNPDCPADIGRNQGQACTTPGGAAGTCPSDAAPGPHVCQ